MVVFSSLRVRVLLLLEHFGLLSVALLLVCTLWIVPYRRKLPRRNEMVMAEYFVAPPQPAINYIELVPSPTQKSILIIPRCRIVTRLLAEPQAPPLQSTSTYTHSTAPGPRYCRTYSASRRRYTRQPYPCQCWPNFSCYIRYRGRCSRLGSWRRRRLGNCRGRWGRRIRIVCRRTSWGRRRRRRGPRGR